MDRIPSPLLVGLAGGTASGKSTLSERVAAALGPQQCLLIEHDRYYRDVPEPRGHNYDHPDALDTDRLVADLDALRSTGEAALPVYSFSEHRRAVAPEPVQARPVVLVEGILVLSDPRLVERFELRAFVHAAADLRLVRRLKRDLANRGRTIDSVLEQYLATVRPMHDTFVEPSRARAQLILSGEGGIEPAVQQLLAAIAATRQAARSGPSRP